MSHTVLDHPLLAERYFFPRPDRVAEPRWVELEDVRLACVHRPAPWGSPTLVHFHGNGEVVTDYVPWFVDLATRIGVGAFLVEYRGYGGSTGAPLLGRMLDDVAPVLRAVGIPPSAMVVHGRSLGSIFAIEAVDRFPEIPALIVESGLGDMFARLRHRVTPAELGTTEVKVREAISARLDHRAKLAGYHGRLLVLHAVDDEVVDVANAHDVYEWAEQADRTLTLFERGGHNELALVNTRSYQSALERFVRMRQP